MDGASPEACDMGGDLADIFRIDGLVVDEIDPAIGGKSQELAGGGQGRDGLGSKFS